MNSEKFNQFMGRVKFHQKKRKHRMLNLKNLKGIKKTLEMSDMLKHNVSSKKMSRQEIDNLQSKCELYKISLGKFEEDIVKRRKDSLQREELKKRKFEDSLKGFFKPDVSQSKRSLTQSRKAYSDTYSIETSFDKRNTLDNDLQTALSHFKNFNSEIKLSPSLDKKRGKVKSQKHRGKKKFQKVRISRKLREKPGYSSMWQDTPSSQNNRYKKEGLNDPRFFTPNTVTPLFKSQNNRGKKYQTLRIGGSVERDKYK